MRYEQFRDAFLQSLRAAGLHSHLGDPTETIELTTTTRRWQAAMGHPIPQRAEPFLVSARVFSEWDPVELAKRYRNAHDAWTECITELRNEMGLGPPHG